MKRRFVLAVAALAGTCCITHGQVLISEVVSGPLPGGNPKFIEIFNGSATTSVTLGTDDKLRIYSNGQSTTNATPLYDFGGNSGANSITLLPGQTWTIASSASDGSNQWNIAYGLSNQPTLFATASFFNGNDAVVIERSGVNSDVFGVIGMGPGVPDGAIGSTDFTMYWSYSGSWARRNANVCAPSATFTRSQWTFPLVATNVPPNGTNSLRQGAADNSAGVWTMNVQNNTSPNTHASICAAGNDCNGNGRPDATDIALGFSRDCNANTVPDECDISSGGSRDCDGNTVPDECQIAANAALDCDRNGALDSCELSGRDCNGNNRLDSCDIALNAALDCNSNGVIDSCELAANDCNNNGVVDACDIINGTSADLNNNNIPDSCEPFVFDCNGNGIEDATDIVMGTSQDCDGDVVPDECELYRGTLTDADGNGTPDACQDAYVGSAFENATVQPSPFGVRNGPNGLAFMNVEGANFGTFASYAGMRFDLAAAKAQFDAAYPGGWTITKAYLYLLQSNAGFTADGGVEIVYTNNDAQNFAHNASPEVTFYENYATDYTDLQQITTYLFVRGPTDPTHPGGNGTIESHLMFDASGSNTAGGDALAAEANAGLGQLTLLLHDTDPAVAATYAGYTNFNFHGPQIVLFATGTGNGCPPCAADFNQDGGVTGDDVGAFFAEFESGNLCGDVNEDGGVTGDDVAFFFEVFEAGDPNC